MERYLGSGATGSERSEGNKRPRDPGESTERLDDSFSRANRRVRRRDSVETSEGHNRQSSRGERSRAEGLRILHAAEDAHCPLGAPTVSSQQSRPSDGRWQIQGNQHGAWDERCTQAQDFVTSDSRGYNERRKPDDTHPLQKNVGFGLLGAHRTQTTDNSRHLVEERIARPTRYRGTSLQREGLTAYAEASAAASPERFREQLPSTQELERNISSSINQSMPRTHHAQSMPKLNYRTTKHEANDARSTCNRQKNTSYISSSRWDTDTTDVSIDNFYRNILRTSSSATQPQEPMSDPMIRNVPFMLAGSLAESQHATHCSAAAVADNAAAAAEKASWEDPLFNFAKDILQLMLRIKVLEQEQLIDNHSVNLNLATQRFHHEMQTDLGQQLTAMVHSARRTDPTSDLYSFNEYLFKLLNNLSLVLKH